MSRRTIDRKETEPVKPEEAPKTEVSPEVGINTPPPVSPAVEQSTPVAEPPKETPKAKPEPEVKPIDASFKLAGAVCVAAIRVVNGYILFNDGLKMNRLPIKKGVPITVTLRQ